MNTNDPQHQDDASLSCVLNDGDNQNVSLQLYDDEVAKDDDYRNASILLVDNVNENDGDNATNPFEKNLKEDDVDNRVPTNDDGEDSDTSILLVEKENDGVSNQFDNNVEEDHRVDSNFYKNCTENYGDNLPVLHQLDDDTHENGGDNVNNSKRLDSELNTDVDKNDNTKTYGDDIVNPYPENNDVASEDEDQLNAYNDYDGDENENDMYFMDDGGYNSFVMEMPPDENEQAENTVNENVSAASPRHEPSVKNNGDNPSIGESAYELQGEITDAIDNGDNHVTDKNQPLTNVSTNVSCSKACDDKDEEMNKAPHRDKLENESILYTDIGHDSFDIEAILNAASSTKNRAVPPTATATTTKTPSTCLTVTTPLNKLHETKRRYLQATETTPGENAEVRIAACKQFRPGCSKHPETNEPITPMPNYADLPTPDLKDKIKKIALRELPKEKMVSKLIEVYKYQHNFSHWEEEPVRAKRKTRKTTKKQQKDARATGTESNENDNDGVPKKKARNQTTTTTKKRTATSTTKGKTITSQSQSTTIVLAQSIMGKPSQKENEEEEREEPRTQSTVYGDETDDTASKSKKTGKKAPKLPLATDEDLFAFIQNDMDVYQKILSYQPIEGNQLFERMKSTASFTASKKAFEQFLDEQCICTKKEENSKPTRKRGR